MTNNKPFRVKNINVDPSGNLIFMEGHDVELEPRVMDVLCVLAASANTVVLRDKLIEQAWDVEHVSDESVTRVIFLLRKAFKQFDPQSVYIQTVPKRGYRLSANVEYEPYEIKAVVVTGKFKPKIRNINAANRLAILPFKQFDDIGGELYLAEGMVEDLSSRLARNSAVALVGRTSIDAVVGNGLTLPEMALKLEVSYLIEGSIYRRAARVTLSIRLIEGVTGEQIWSDKFEIPDADVMELRGEIGTKVIADLYRILDVKQTAAPVRRMTPN